MYFKNNSKQRTGSIQGLRSFKDTLPKNIKKVINKKGHIYSETISNWKYIVGENLFNICYPKSFKNSNKFGVSTLLVMVKRGNEVDLEYSKKEIMNKMNSFFGYSVVENLKLKDLGVNLTSQLGGAIIFSKIFMKYFVKKKKGNLIHIASIQG